MELITEYTGAFVGGKLGLPDYQKFLNPPPVDTRTPEEIAADVIRRAGLEVRNESS